MPEIPQKCQALKDKLDELQLELDAAAQDLASAPAPTKSAWAKIVSTFEVQVSNAKADLKACLTEQAAKPPVTSSLTIVGVERTQAIQYFGFHPSPDTKFGEANSVPMIAQKELILRTYINVGTDPAFPTPTSVDGMLRYGGSFQPSENGPIAALPSNNIQRGNVNHTLNFRVPAGDCTGSVYFSLKVYDPAHLDDPAFTSQPEAFTITFEDVPSVNIHAVLINLTGVSPQIDAPSLADLKKTLGWVESVYPISRFKYPAVQEIDFDGDLTLSGGFCGTGWDTLMDTLQNMAAASDTNDIFVGVLDASASATSNAGGCGGGGPKAASFVGESEAFAQEIGHALGRWHAPCPATGPNAPKNIDSDYPKYDPYPSGSIGEFGFDTEASDVYDPGARNFDYMSYWMFCGGVWTSPYTYLGLKNAIVESSTTVPQGRQKRDYLHLNFRVYHDGRIELLPSFHLFGSAPITGGGIRTSIWYELLDAQQRIIDFRHCYLNNPHQELDDPVLTFYEVIPWNPAVQTIAFHRNDELLYTLEVPPHALDVRVQAPRYTEEGGNRMHLEWEATGADRPITYLLRYSHDGGRSWRPIAANLTKSQYDVNMDMLPGGSECRFQVVAAALIRTATAETRPFEVIRKPRQISILSPKPNQTVMVGNRLVLHGFCFSPDFGSPEFEDMLWTSNRDGLIGVGDKVITNRLSRGWHQITLSAPDGMGGAAASSIAVTVTPKV